MKWSVWSVKGLTDGNAGPYKDEAAYVQPKGLQDKLDEKTDADIIWMYDMRDELGVFPHSVTSSSAIVVGNTVLRGNLQRSRLVSHEYPRPSFPELDRGSTKTPAN